MLYEDLLGWNLWEANILLRVAPATAQTIIGELGSLFQSYWGLFGWLNLPYPDWIYWAFQTITVVVVLGLLVALVQNSRRVLCLNARWFAVAILLLWLVLLIISWLRFMFVAPAAQGRYFFPAAPTLVFLAATSLLVWRRLRLGTLVVIALSLLSLLTPAWILAPAYTAPAPVATLPTELTPVNVAFAGGITLVGVNVPEVTVLPGDSITVTAAWRADAQPSRNLSVFVHLLDTNFAMFGGHDGTPSPATPAWAMGTTIENAHTFTLPPTTPAGHYQIELGLYDDDQDRLPLLTTEGAEGADRLLLGPLEVVGESYKN